MTSDGVARRFLLQSTLAGGSALRLSTPAVPNFMRDSKPNYRMPSILLPPLKQTIFED